LSKRQQKGLVSIRIWKNILVVLDGVDRCKSTQFRFKEHANQLLQANRHP
jgi:hypothetical protein